LKKLVAAFAVLLWASALAGVDANTATQAELESISGIGPALSTAIVEERKKGDFKDWNDLFRRVRGVGDRSAAKLSAAGLTIAGKAYGGANDKAHGRPAPSPAGSAPSK
jgi:competence protein ComEA